MLNAAGEYETKQWFSKESKHICKLLGLFKDIKDVCVNAIKRQG